MMLLFVFQKFAMEPLACGSCCHSNFEYFEVFSTVEEVKQKKNVVYSIYLLHVSSFSKRILDFFPFL